MTEAFESEKNKKAFLYTSIICGIILLLFILIKWKVYPTAIPVVQDLIEINLGNNEEGWGEEQPLIKGNRTPPEETVAAPSNSKDEPASEDNVQPEDNAPDDAAAVVKPVKLKLKTTAPVTTTPVVAPAPKPQKPKITYPGSEQGKPGNNPTDDNGFNSQGKKKNGINDDGDVKGNRDSYGKTPGGSVSGPKVTKGNRKIIRHYSFTGELNKATIYAIIKVSPAGQGRFVGFDKYSTSRSAAYSAAISNYLRTMEFDKSADESTVTVQFNFTVN